MQNLLIILFFSEYLRQVPDKLENYMSKKHYLHATNLIVSSVASLEGELAGVEALRDHAQDLKIKKEVSLIVCALGLCNSLRTEVFGEKFIFSLKY
jgi:NADH dehydrogenase/NADH:ubiquinone oxidoreductase subunit G